MQCSTAPPAGSRTSATSSYWTAACFAVYVPAFERELLFTRPSSDDRLAATNAAVISLGVSGWKRSTPQDIPIKHWCFGRFYNTQSLSGVVPMISTVFDIMLAGATTYIQPNIGRQGMHVSYQPYSQASFGVSWRRWLLHLFFLFK